ncbi:YceI family protein [Salinimicrobium oceani]|uniref:YceI family protein n=1 Tax=Salinimicrobium oceani TaxID=2722702 RepID=A0ABX1D0X6_9FLAO|nr:YceI family protein [Salinimicrobium oceani]NJW52328.1 YceI family protein [Salinimicrobium oceani]
MKKIAFIALVLFCGSIIYAQDYQKKQITILPASNLTIIGDSNIAKFQCKFDTSYLEGTQQISFTQTGHQIKFQGASLTLNNRGFDCGSKGINSDFHDLLQTRKHPEIVLELNEVALSSNNKGLATIYISIAGKKKHFQVPVSIKNGAIAQFQGILSLNIKDYDLEPPKKLFGMIVVKDVIEIEFDLHVKK